MMGSVIDFAFNGGPALYCKSSMMRNFWTGNYAAGCQAYMLYIYQIDRRFNPPKKLILRGFYDPAKGTGRRVDERDACLKGLSYVRH